jgi:hypothetical protein
MGDSLVADGQNDWNLSLLCSLDHRLDAFKVVYAHARQALIGTAGFKKQLMCRNPGHGLNLIKVYQNN